MKKSKLRIYLLLVPCMLVIIAGELIFLDIRGTVGSLSMDTVQGEPFRAMNLSDGTYEKILKEAERTGEEPEELLAVSMVLHRFSLTPFRVESGGRYRRAKKLLLDYRENAYNQLLEAYRSVWQGTENFPVAKSVHLSEDFSYEDSWMQKRSYAGKRNHEGCDIFGTVQKPGYYPVLSVTSGYVEQIGWLTLGGYRIGIRSDTGGYFYYAHLSSYGRDFAVGERIWAGEVLGYMGDTGYGEEGTAGKFPPHLHFGIYISGKESAEISVNPYPILRYLEKNVRKFAF